VTHRVVAVLAALSLSVLTLTAVTGAPASAAGCAGATRTWTGNGDGHTAADPANWTPSGAAAAGDDLTVTATGGDQISPLFHGPVCSLTVTATDGDVFPSNDLTTAAEVTDTLSLTGGTGPDPHQVGITGAWHAARAVVAGYVSDSADPYPGLLAFDDLRLAPGADLWLGSSDTNLAVHTLTLGADAGITSNSGTEDGTGNAQLQVAPGGSITLTSDVTLSGLHLVLGQGAVVNLGGHALTLDGGRADFATGAGFAGPGRVEMKNGYDLSAGAPVDLGGATVALTDVYPHGAVGFANGTVEVTSVGTDDGSVAGTDTVTWVVGGVTVPPRLGLTAKKSGSHAVKVSVRLPRGTVSVALAIPAKVAKKLKLRALVGKATAAVDGPTKLTVKVKAKARKKLAKYKKKVPVTVTASYLGPYGITAEAVATVKLAVR
jgi:hypothetical protein